MLLSFAVPISARSFAETTSNSSTLCGFDTLNEDGVTGIFITVSRLFTLSVMTINFTSSQQKKPPKLLTAA